MYDVLLVSFSDIIYYLFNEIKIQVFPFFAFTFFLWVIAAQIAKHVELLFACSVLTSWWLFGIRQFIFITERREKQQDHVQVLR